MTIKKARVVESGPVEILVGSSSADIALRAVASVGK
jgi:hypothetical protein